MEEEGIDEQRDAVVRNGVQNYANDEAPDVAEEVLEASLTLDGLDCSDRSTYLSTLKILREWFSSHPTNEVADVFSGRVLEAALTRRHIVLAADEASGISSQKCDEALEMLMLSLPFLPTLETLINVGLRVETVLCAQKLLKSLLKKRLPEFLLERCLQSPSARPKETSYNLFKKIPPLVGNVCKVEVPFWATPLGYGELMLPPALQCLRSLREKLADEQVSVHVQTEHLVLYLMAVLSCVSDRSAIKHFFLPLKKMCQEDFIIRRLMSKFCAHVPYGSQEHFFALAFQSGCTVEVLGEEVLASQMSCHYLEKLVTFRYFRESILLRTLVDYLLMVSNQQPFIRVMKEVVGIWSSVGPGDKLFINLEHHIYVSKVLLYALKVADVEMLKKVPKLEMSLIEGVTRHLETNRVELREIGMFIGKLGMGKLRDGTSVDFDLQNLAPMVQEMVDDLQCKVPGEHLETSGEEEQSKDQLLDEDDDQEADRSKEEELKFRSCRDLVEAIVDAGDDVLKLNSAVKYAKDIIDRTLHGSTRMAVELLGIFLSITEEAFLKEDAERCRAEILLTLLKHCPKEGATFLASEFFAEGTYSITQRAMILEILTLAAKELAFPESEGTVEPMPKRPKEDDPKTRYFFRLQKLEKPPAVNAFNAVAPSFFFPLVLPMLTHSGTPTQQATLVTETMLYEKYILALSKLLACSVHLPMIDRMAACAVEFVWSESKRESRNAIITKALLILVGHCAMVMKNPVMYLKEVCGWLRIVAVTDPDDCYRSMALEVGKCVEDILRNSLFDSLKMSQDKADASMSFR